MLLVIDVSNTNMVLGVFNGENLVANWRLSTKSGRTADETGLLICSLFAYSDVSVGDIEAIIVSSVVPDAGLKTGINLRMENPKEMGTDRIVNLVAAYELYGGPAIVVDYETATTFDVVSEKGEFLTGITAPGLQTCADALYQRAANLPKFEIVNPESVITKNTVESMQAGLVVGHIGEAKFIIQKIKEHFNCPNMKVIATGGLGKVIYEEENGIFDVYDPVLSLHGLRLIYGKNKNKR